MNQRGNEPMASAHFKIPVETMEKLEEKATACGVTKSELIRLCVEYVLAKDIQLAQKVYFFDPQRKE